jgi:hypothetical protein
MTMRDFFKQELKSLSRNTGLKQYEKILELEGWEKETSELLDALCKVCNQFDYIPNEDKAKIIKQNIITDQEFTGFNARIIYKWLSQAKSVYFKEAAHVPSGPSESAPILEGEERKKMLQKWLESLGEGVKSVPKMTESEIKATGKIDVVEKKATGYSPRVITVEEFEKGEAIKREAAIKYREIYDFSKFKHYPIEGFEIFAASKEDAQEIYNKTVK